MKKLLSLILVFALVLSALSFSALAVDGIRLAAHRGMNELAPENTLPAFELAGEKGFFGLEFDLQLTKDGFWVVCHENELERMTDGKGLISEKTFDQVRRLNVIGGTNPEKYPENKIPTLDEALDVCEAYSMIPFIEVKAGDEDDLDSLAAHLSERGFDGDNSRVISSNKSYVSYFKRNYPQFTVWFVSYFSLGSDVDFSLENGLDGISLNAMFFKNELAEKVISGGLTFSLWGVDKLEDAERFAALGSLDFTTNNLVYADDGSVAALQEGDEATGSALKRIIELGKTIINRIKTIVDYVRRFIGSFIPE